MLWNFSESYYDRPFQVIFLRPDRYIPTYEKGIAYKNSIVAAKDGVAFPTKKVMKYARQHGVDVDYAIVESFEWLPFNID